MIIVTKNVYYYLSIDLTNLIHLPNTRSSLPKKQFCIVLYYFVQFTVWSNPYTFSSTLQSFIESKFVRLSIELANPICVNGIKIRFL